MKKDRNGYRNKAWERGLSLHKFVAPVIVNDRLVQFFSNKPQGASRPTAGHEDNYWWHTAAPIGHTELLQPCVWEPSQTRVFLHDIDKSNQI